MNAQRRKEIRNLIDQIEELKNAFEEYRDIEQDVLDSIPENLAGSERYERTESTLDALENVIGSLEKAMANAEDLR